MTTAVIVQARIGSSRLPGKVLQPLAGMSVLEIGLSRCARIPGVDRVVCATTTHDADDAVVALAERAGATVFRGSETDVLARYRGAAEAVDSNRILRVTSDCPLIDPDLCGRVLTLQAESGADYACNNMPPSWPHGLDCEAFTRAALDAAAATATEAYDREHVTPWIRNNPALEQVNLPRPGESRYGLRWTLDYPEDLSFFQAVFDYFGSPDAVPGTEELIAFLDARRDIQDLNAFRGQKPG